MSIWSKLMGGDARDTALAASQDQYAKQIAAADASRAAGNDYLSGIMNVSQNYSPYASGGNAAYTQLLGGLGLGGDPQAFTNAYRSLPGYQAGMDSGLRGVTASLAAPGGAGVRSGAAMNALYKKASDYEDQRSGDYLNRLYQLAGQGLTATDAQSKLQAQGYTGQLQGNLAGSGQQYGSAGTIGQGMVAGANAEAQGIQNLFNMGTNLAGRFIGGGFGSSFGA